MPGNWDLDREWTDGSYDVVMGMEVVESVECEWMPYELFS